MATVPGQRTLGPARNQAELERQALALIQQGQLPEAEAAYRQLISSGTGNHLVYGNLAAICLMHNRSDEAIALLNQALRLKPDFADGHCSLGLALKRRGDIDAAIAAYSRALELDPALPDAHNNLGVALKERGDLPAAVAAHSRALQLQPHFPEAQLNRGVALQQLGELAAATAAYRAALELRPAYADAHHNLGLALQEQGELDAARASLQRALQLDPGHAEAQTSLAMAELLLGHYASGWERYEHRFRTRSGQTILNAQPGCPRWDGGPLPAQKPLLLVGEQGLGDTLQFMRYALVLRQRGVAVSLCAHPKLHGLIQASGIDAAPLTPQQGNQVGEGQWLPLLSLPRHLGVSPENPLITAPYIRCSEELIARWRELLAGEGGPIIGLNWQGNPSHETSSSIGRSLPLEALAPLARIEGVRLLSLQKGAGSEQLEGCSFRDRFVGCQAQVSEIWDFEETAAIIAACDLVITSDTAVAHLAGGMGKATWLLLKQVPEWRWGLEGERSFWYPSLRLFRQRRRGDWAELLERVAAALGEQLQRETATVGGPGAGAILAPISLGELIDKITILQIKSQHVQGEALANVRRELAALEARFGELDLRLDGELIEQLKAVNQELWQIEDAIREQERQQSFGERFIALARAVYQQNDRRAAIKKQINLRYGSALVEEKAYQAY
ncbi:MAG: DUF6165 family protein [Cyanobacteriota bacterium]|nr:DUF6165 family protein [Cyanobacteriota bacterium]